MRDGITRRAALLTSLPVFSLAAVPMRKRQIAIFSKHLQFLQGAELARTAAEIGFKAVDLTVRRGGHVEPARAAQELPPLVSIIRQHGLQVPMVTTDIVDVESPNIRTVLKTLADLDIHYYRWGGFKYIASQPLSRQLDDLRQRSARLAALNAEYKVCAIYHTHSGVDLVGAPVWDIFQVLKDLDSNAVAINYDVGHATVEGGLGGWIDSFRLAESHIRGIAFKDFAWQKDTNGDWAPAWVPLGQGMVRFRHFVSMLANSTVDGPIQLHFEYPLGGAENGKRQLTMPRDEVFSAMRRDLHQLRSYLSEAGLADA
jgi:sugar phosphate isomerase/epimerase